jgi:hypothetical protein
MTRCPKYVRTVSLSMTRIAHDIMGASQNSSASIGPAEEWDAGIATQQADLGRQPNISKSRNCHQYSVVKLVLRSDKGR